MKRLLALTGLVVVGLAAAAAWAADPLTRDGARQAAERELSKSAYHADDPSLVRRILDHVLSWLDDAFSKLSGATPGGGAGLLVIAAALVVVLIALLRKGGPLRRTRRPADPTGVDSAGTPDEHRRRAAELTAAGAYAEAVREWMRAIARELEGRGVLEPRPGRTADEIAREAGALVPDIAGPLAGAAGTFGEVWYGGRPGTAERAEAMRSAEEQVRRASLAVRR